MTKADETRPRGSLATATEAGEAGSYGIPYLDSDNRLCSPEDDSTMPYTLRLTLDSVEFPRKPVAQAGAITRRMQQSGASSVTVGEFASAIGRGCTWCGGCFEPSVRGWGAFLGLRVFALDFDNKDPERGELHDGEHGFMSPAQALSRCEPLGLEPLLWYETFSSRPGHVRFRLVFDFCDVVSDTGEAGELISALLGFFPEADQQCRNANRLFYGAPGPDAVRICKAGGGHV